MKRRFLSIYLIVFALQISYTVAQYQNFIENGMEDTNSFNFNAQEFLKSESSKRVIRSNRKGGDADTGSSSPQTNPEENDNQDQTMHDDSVSSKMIETICNLNTTTNGNKSSTDIQSNAKEEILCALLKRFSKASTTTKSEMNQFLPEDYNKYEAPVIKENFRLRNNKIETIQKPVSCETFLNVRGIVDFDESNGIITLDMDVILMWTDGNILNKYTSLTEKQKANYNTQPQVLSPNYLKKLWTPDIYIEEVMSLSQPTFMGNSITVVLNPQSGVIVYRSRVLAKLSCEMDFRFYPADTQTCSFTIKSFSYTTERLELSWAIQEGTGVYLQQTSDPNFYYQISAFTSNQTILDIGPASDPSSLYSSLQFTLLSRRKMTYHLVQTYFASIFFVIVTWLCFLISPDMFEVRVGIAMSTLLTLTAMFASVRDASPQVSYVKAIDCWMVACILFIFIALAGFTVTAWIKRGLLRIQGANDDDNGILDILDHQNKKVLNEKQKKKQLKKYRTATIMIECYGVYILSMAYVIFNVVYWYSLLYESNYLNWNVNSTYNKLDS